MITKKQTNETGIWWAEEGAGYQLLWPRSEYVIVLKPPLKGWVPGKPGPRVPGTPVVLGYGGRLRKAAPHWPAPWPVGGVFAAKWWPQERPTPADVYNPVEVASEILLDAQRAAGDDPKVLLRFVNKWGQLGVGVPGDPQFLDGVEYTGHCLTLLKEWIEAYYALRQGRNPLHSEPPEWIKALPMLRPREWVKAPPPKRKALPTLKIRSNERVYEGRKAVAFAPEWVRVPRPKMKRPRWTWRELAFALNERLREIHVAAYPEKRALLPIYRPRNLYRALWLEVWRQATGMNRFRRCPECRALFVPARTNQQYCTRQCANRPTVRRWKREQKRKRRLAQQKEEANGTVQT